MTAGTLARVCYAPSGILARVKDSPAPDGTKPRRRNRHPRSSARVSEEKPPVRRRVGRPVDETAEKRILEAGLRIYGREGWGNVTMSAIATEAKVGKALLYSRFTNTTDIIVIAFRSYITQLEGEFDDIRDLLLAEANRMADLYLGEDALAHRRAVIDAAAGVEPFPQIAKEMAQRTVLPMRAHVHEAIERGELPPWTDVTRLLDVIEGAVRMHVLAAPSLTAEVKRHLRTYTKQLVDEQLLLLDHLGPQRTEQTPTSSPGTRHEKP